MSGAMRALEREYEQGLHATKLLVETKVAARCPAHGHLVSTEIEPVSAYKLGIHRRKRSAELRGLFRTVRELTDAIKSAFETDVSDVCPHGDCSWRGEWR